MKLLDQVSMVGSGSALGIGLTHPLDCHVYLLDGGTELALIDAGVGIDTERILRVIEGDHYDLSRIKYLFLTHGHADHAGGAARLKELLGLSVVAPRSEADFIRTGDERSIGLDVAKKAGFYPDDYVFRPCQVDREVKEGDRVTVGDLCLDVIDTPGHSIGGVVYLVRLRSCLAAFVGDLVAHGGAISLQNIPGADVQAYSRSVLKLENRGIDAFFPGHLCFSLSDGQKHIDKAAAAFRRLGVPPSVI